jgi:hypothetical protein
VLSIFDTAKDGVIAGLTRREKAVISMRFGLF